MGHPTYGYGPQTLGTGFGDQKCEFHNTDYPTAKNVTLEPGMFAMTVNGFLVPGDDTSGARSRGVVSLGADSHGDATDGLNVATCQSHTLRRVTFAEALTAASLDATVYITGAWTAALTSTEHVVLGTIQELCILDDNGTIDPHTAYVWVPEGGQV